MADLVTYRGPFTGVDVSVPEIDIQPTGTPFSNNFFNYLNELRTRPKIITNINSPNDFIRCFYSFNDIASVLQNVAISPTKIYKADGSATIGTMGSANTNTTLTPIVYNGVLYWPSGNALYSWNGTAFVNPASAYAGGYFINKLAAHVILLNTIEGINSFPQRVRWSASGLPTIWDPTVNTNAGYNDLDTAEGITGFFINGYNGIIATPHSLIEMAPTGNGISPFSFYNFENSPVGVGNYYPNSLDSFGIFNIFAAQDDIYLISQIKGLNSIGGTARAAIYQDLLSLGSGPFDLLPLGFKTGPIGTIINTYISGTYPAVSTDGLYYILAIPQGDIGPFNIGNVVYWVYDLKRNCWFRWVTEPNTYWLTSKYWSNPSTNNLPQAGTYYLA